MHGVPTRKQITDATHGVSTAALSSPVAGASPATISFSLWLLDYFLFFLVNVPVNALLMLY